VRQPTPDACDGINISPHGSLLPAWPAGTRPTLSSPRTPQVRGEGRLSFGQRAVSYIRQTKAHTRRHHPSIHIVDAVPPLSVTATRAVLVFVQRPQNDKSTHRDRPTATVPFSSPSAFIKRGYPVDRFPQQTTCGVCYRHFGSCGQFPGFFFFFFHPAC
jgi:hypothetical protein